ncbi:MAG: MarR family transcriptional regulator [Alphaproteobacteria bacterium]|nr:MAG: MarR family transcriptional regulator [Alphaproteobacteria bacterium]
MSAFPRFPARVQPASREALSEGLLPDLLGYRLRRAQVAVFNDFVRTMTELQLTPGQFGTLVLVDANPGLSQTALGGLLGIDRSTVVPLIDRLEGRGLLRREASPTDRRTHALILTDAGYSLLAEAVARVRAHENRIASSLSPQERTQLIELLAQIG